MRVANLQYGDHRDEISRFNRTAANPLLSFEDIDPLRDLDDFAALLSALDLVISVDNSTVHLAGALGVPTWLLLPYQADWRWRRGLERSEWYKSLRLFWQAGPGTAAWTEVIERVHDELQQVQRASAQHPSQSRDAPGKISTAVGCASATSSAAALPPKADVLLLNDTTYWYHFGCACTSLALHEELRARGLIVDAVPITHINALSPLPTTAAELDDENLFQTFRSRNPGLIERMQNVPSVVVNGEGSIHDLGQTACALLYLAYIAKQRFHRHTRLINHSGYPTADGRSSETIEALYRKVYGSVDFIAVREESSAARLAQLGVNATPAFDCLPLFVARHPPVARRSAERRVVIAGSVQLSPAVIDLLKTLIRQLHQAGYRVEILAGANAWLAHDDVLLLQALHERVGVDCTLVAATSESEWLASIAGAALLISGRFHHSIAAACLGTPLLLMASNTSKNDGLLQRLGLAKDQVWLSPDDQAMAQQRVKALLDDPRRGLVAPATISALQELARRNFQGLPERT
ncbi:MAG TPA: polysaccharide pyruvyl transferase family protein [Steroidobacteraceae bacterium]|nr:polysaccharide pyruvyl transferase family protein [Steroidobacteraceae bacterium]